MLRNVFINHNVVDDTFLNSNKFFTRNEQLLISFRVYINIKDSVDFGNLHVSNREFSDIFRIINFAFDEYYPQLRSEAFILDKLFSIISRSVEKKYPNWFIQDECAAHRKDLVSHHSVATIALHIKESPTTSECSAPTDQWRLSD